MAVVGCDLESKDFTLLTHELFGFGDSDETSKDIDTTGTETRTGLRGNTQTSVKKPSDFADRTFEWDARR